MTALSARETWALGFWLWLLLFWAGLIYAWGWIAAAYVLVGFIGPMFLVPWKRLVR
jgi:hypothetical protein